MSQRPRHGSLRPSAITVAVAAVVVVADQLATSWAVHRLSRGPLHIIGPLTLQLQVNTGSAFGLAQGWAPVIGALAVVVVVVLIVVSRRAGSDGMAAALGLVVGGAVGNLVDRVFRHYHGGVVDFIALHFWPTFNVADACITVGIVLVAWGLWRGPGLTSPGGAGGAEGSRGGSGQADLVAVHDDHEIRAVPEAVPETVPDAAPEGAAGAVRPPPARP